MYMFAVVIFGSVSNFRALANWIRLQFNDLNNLCKIIIITINGQGNIIVVYIILFVCSVFILFFFRFKL